MEVKLAEEPARYEEGVERLLRLHAAELDPLTAGVPREEALTGPVPTYAKPFLKQALDSHLIVALDDDERVIGALCFRRCTRERLADWTPSAHVTFTLVAADHRGEGVARSLNERFVNDAAPRLSEVTHITRETWSENRASRSYIESMGFDEVDRIPDDRGPGVDTVFYAREIDAAM